MDAGVIHYLNLSRCNGIGMALLHGLDDDEEGGIAVNLLPLVAQKYSKRTALTLYTER